MRLSEEDRPKKLTQEEKDEKAKDMFLGAAVVLVPLFLIDWFFLDRTLLRGLRSTFHNSAELAGLLWVLFQELVEHLVS